MSCSQRLCSLRELHEERAFLREQCGCGVEGEVLIVDLLDELADDGVAWAHCQSVKRRKSVAGRLRASPFDLLADGGASDPSTREYEGRFMRASAYATTRLAPFVYLAAGVPARYHAARWPGTTG